MRRGVEHDGAGKVIEGKVQAYTGLQQLANLIIRFVAAECGIDFDKYNLGHAQAEGAANLAGNQLRNQRQNTLSCTAEFDHVEPKVISLHNGGQRASFAQGKHITRRIYGSQHRTFSLIVQLRGVGNNKGSSWI